MVSRERPGPSAAAAGGPARTRQRGLMTHAPTHPGTADASAALGAEATTFRAATRIVSGLGALAQVRAEVERIGSPRLVVVADRGLDRAGLLDRIVSEVNLDDLV